MRKLIFVLSYSFYLFFVLGFILHTSANPQIFDKYTLKYLLFIITLFAFLPLFLWFINFASKPTVVKRKKKKYTITPRHKVLLFALSLCLLLLPLEIFLRYQYQSYESNSYQYTIHNFHPFLQFQITDTYTTPVNTHGFRGKVIQKEKPEDTYRIFVLGGSSVLNRGVSFEKSAPRILEQSLQKQSPNKRIEVMNAGVDGYTTEHSLIAYLFNIKDFDPDLIIMWHGINDWYYSCNPEQRSYESYQSDYSHFLNANASMAFTYFKPQPVITLKLVTLDFLGRFLQNNWYSDIKDWGKKNNPGIYSERSKHDTYEMKKFASLPSYKRNLQSFIQATEDDGVKLILGNQPFLYSMSLSKEELTTLIFPKLQCTNAEGKYPNIVSMINAMNSYNKAVKDIAAEKEISFVDLEAKLPKNKTYFVDDVHYTEKGNQKVAETLYQYILTNNILE